MSKIGVGVGEDFPVDETALRRDEPPRGEDGYAEWAARREAYRQWREQRREWKRRWREEWRTHRRRFREQFRDSYRDGTDGRPAMVMGHPFFWDEHALWRVIAAVAALAVIVFAVTHIYFVLGALVVAALCFAAFRRGFDPFDLHFRHDHDQDRAEPLSRPAPPAEAPRDSANPN
jgi:hypothetical protein